jgi:hypothetical protein
MTNWTPRASNILSVPLRITEATVADGQITLTWTAVPGTTYRVHYKGLLRDDAEWIVLGAPVLATGFAASITDVPPAGTRFYRIVRANSE